MFLKAILTGVVSLVAVTAFAAPIKETVKQTSPRPATVKVKPSVKATGCCGSGAACCYPGSPCCSVKKAVTAKSCCGSGGACCGGGSACCSK